MGCGHTLVYVCSTTVLFVQGLGYQVSTVGSGQGAVAHSQMQ